MAELKKCRTCGADVQSNAPFGHCPKCLLELGFGPAPAEAWEESFDGTNVRAFGDYELLEQIGRGGMGIVYKAQQNSLHRTVALKMIASGEFASPSALQRFHIEAEAAAKLDHPNIVPIYEVGAHRGQHFFSMKYVEGRSLDKEIRNGKFHTLAGETTSSKSATRQQQSSIARLLATVARSVHFAHQHGVLHRDLKPANILLDREGQPHLTDFGLAKILEHDVGVTRSKDLLGTPTYMSPELAAGKPVTRASDIYSLGVILYELLTGRPPFRADTPMETLRRVTDEEPTHPTALNRQADPELATICLKCLEKDPLRRYATAEAMAEDLERWLRREPIHARRASAAEKFVRWCQRKPAQAAVAGLLVLLSIVSTISAVKLAKLSRQRGSAVALLRRDLYVGLEMLWTNSSEPYLLISSDKMAALRGEAPVFIPAGIASMDLRFAVYTHQKPTNMLEMMSPVLGKLEKSLATSLSRPVRIDLRIYRHYDSGEGALAKGEVDFMRLGPASYVETKYLNPRISLLLAQNGRVKGCIFVNAQTGIRSLADLKGKTMAFVDDSSTTGNYVPKVQLLKYGFTAQDLKIGDTNFLGSHDSVVKAVAARRYDAGAANASVVEDFIKENPGIRLRVLQESPEEFAGLPWAAAAGLDPSVANAIRDGLLSIQDKGILKALGNNTSGFIAVRDENYDELRQLMKAAEKFDRVPSKLPGAR